MTIARSSGWMRIAVEIICSTGGCPGKFLWAVGRGFSNWIGPDGRGAVGRAVAEFGGNDQRVLRVRFGGARAGNLTFVRIAGRRKVAVGGIRGGQFRAPGVVKLAVVRVSAHADI